MFQQHWNWKSDFFAKFQTWPQNAALPRTAVRNSLNMFSYKKENCSYCFPQHMNPSWNYFVFCWLSDRIKCSFLKVYLHVRWDQEGGIWGHAWETGGGPDSSLYRTLHAQFTSNEVKDFEVIFPRTGHSKLVSFCIVGVREIRLLSQLRSERSLSQCPMDILSSREWQFCEPR